MIEMITNSKYLKNTLTARGLKPTYQRVLILEYLNQNQHKHLTADNIYNELSRKAPTLSLTTVYNTLSSFHKTGLIGAITITGTEVRYDVITTPHHHLLCRQCGRIVDIDVECPNAQRKSINGYKIEEVHGYFIGVCRECLKKGRKQQSKIHVK